jgi:AMP nucleosidase
MVGKARPAKQVFSAEEAVDVLEAYYATAAAALREGVERFLAGGVPPTPQERSLYRYPELTITYAPDGLVPTSPRAYAKFSMPGGYTTTVTQPEAFRAYLIEQLHPLMAEFDAKVEVGLSAQEIPYPYVFERGDELGRGGVSAADLALHFPIPLLSEVGDEIADGLWDYDEQRPRPLALFDAVRVDFSLRRLVHYTGTDWRAVQPWILLTNYHRYVDQFIRRGVQALRHDKTYDRLVLPGGITLDASTSDDELEAIFQSSPWQRFQMPAYHLTTKNGQGVTLVNIGVGPANAKNITDHLAVLRPHAWLMVGHCGGLRQSQRIGDYVLAHAYLREDGILDSVVPTEIPIPALAEIQVALQDAAAYVTGDKGEALKRRLRTGTVVTYDDRNWELRWSKERRRINLSRAIAVDMESGTIAAQGFRFRVPYGTLLCVSDKPLHGEIKLPGAANAFYERAISEHLEIGIAALDHLRGLHGTVHSRKLRSFDEPPFR